MQPTLNIHLTPAPSNKKNQIYRVIRSYETITSQYIKGGARLQICDYGNLFPCSKYEQICKYHYKASATMLGQWYILLCAT